MLNSYSSSQFSRSSLREKRLPLSQLPLPHAQRGTRATLLLVVAI
ncbi:hypothetical protein FQN60_011491 [Etheostoma spectabile]|uniref:Uncharacterized protein n=1 Tax=Etheostoma spectabile TaxID=54343 RepID=A0A5J5C8G6_9PERO|nr:hypothetical protein FQN60_011491 [Etheostoma spectabile]